MATIGIGNSDIEKIANGLSKHLDHHPQRVDLIARLKDSPQDLDAFLHEVVRGYIQVKVTESGIPICIRSYPDTIAVLVKRLLEKMGAVAPV